jgi:pilus assembly protein Flp/PilA
MLNNLLFKLYTATRREEGQAMAEYGIILALIAVALVVILGALKTGLAGTFQDVIDHL